MATFLRRWAALLALAVAATYLVVKWRREPSKGLVQGVVVNEQGNPVRDVRVRVRGTNQFTDTESGSFMLAVSDPDAVITAALPGHIIGSAPAKTRPLVIKLKRVPVEDHAGYAWVDPRPDESDEHRCGNCHAPIYQEWQQSAHSRAANGERLIDLWVDHGSKDAGKFNWSLVREYPEGAGVCASCHAPSVDALDPNQSDLAKISGVAATGVHCDFCHKIADTSLEHVGLAHGVAGLKLSRPREGQRFFGPLDDVDRGEDVWSLLQRESQICASCHEGTLFGVKVYTTYSEWLDSPAKAAGKQCQTCHMTPTGKLTNFAPGAGGLERDPKSLASHTFLPGGIEKMLRQAVAVKAEVRGEQVTVRLTAKDVGHRVPTGFIDRHLLLVVEACSENEPIPLVQGAKLPSAAGAALQNLPGEIFGRLLRDPDGFSPAPFWRAGVKFEDTRLLPGETRESVYTFAKAAQQVRVRLLYRKFWPDVAEAKGWPDDTLTLHDEVIPNR